VVINLLFFKYKNNYNNNSVGFNNYIRKRRVVPIAFYLHSLGIAEKNIFFVKKQQNMERIFFQEYKAGSLQHIIESVPTTCLSKSKQLL